MSIEIKSDILAKELNQGIVPLGVPKAYQYDAALVEAARAAVNQGIDDVAEAGDTAVNSVKAQESTSTTNINTLGDKILAQMKHGYGYPFTAATAAAMADTAKIYVYTGSETGYTNGNWYYWNGTAWTSGGVYNATALETDTTLTVSGAAADAKVVGHSISDVNNDLQNSLNMIFDGKTSINNFDFVFKGQLDDGDGSFAVKTNIGFCATEKYYRVPVTNPSNSITVHKVNDPNVKLVIHFYNSDFSHGLSVRISETEKFFYVAYPYFRVMIYNQDYSELQPSTAKNYVSFDVETEAISNFVSKKSIIRVASNSLSYEEKVGYDYICDGLADDEEIQNAIDSLGSLGGEVILSRGNFNISHTINISTSINIHGCGGTLSLNTSGENNVKKTILNVTDKLVDCFTIIDCIPDSQGIEIHDMQIAGKGMRQAPYNSAIRVKSYVDVARFYNLYISGMGYGICGMNDCTFDAVWIHHNSIQRCGLGIYIDRGGQCQITNNIIWDSRGIYQDLINNCPFIVECGGMFLYTFGNAVISHNEIGRPSFIDDGNNGTADNPRGINALHFRNCQSIVLSDNVISEVYASAIKLTNSHHLNINNNQINYFGAGNVTADDACGIQMNNCNKVKINGNYFSGLKNQAATGITINSQYAIKEMDENCELNFITGNYITGVQQSVPIHINNKSFKTNNCFEDGGTITII